MSFMFTVHAAILKMGQARAEAVWANRDFQASIRGREWESLISREAEKESHP